MDDGASTYGDRWASVYDEWVEGFPSLADVDQMVETLAGLAGEGPALELGIGTGRVALPLAQRGIAVSGIDASEAMVARLREKPGGEGIPVTVGDFTEIPVDGPFRLVFVVFNTLFALPSQEAQVRCFASVAGVLEDGGAFVVEAFVPDPGRFDRGQRVETSALGDEAVQLRLSTHDAVEQRVAMQELFIGGGRIDMRPVHIRYAWPSELDLMARLAGMRLRERWGGWEGEPFEASSRFHVSIYERDERDERG
jgi:SAM-dependent methyltransferase